MTSRLFDRFKSAYRRLNEGSPRFRLRWPVVCLPSQRQACADLAQRLIDMQAAERLSNEALAEILEQRVWMELELMSTEENVVFEAIERLRAMPESPTRRAEP